MITLCKPLEIINISGFSHLRSFHDGRFAVLCNNPEFLLNYARKKYYNTDPCVHIIKPQTYDIGQYLVWDSIDCYGKTAAMLQDSADFGFKHVFTIIKHHALYTDFYHFGTHISNPTINQMYVNNLDLLDGFLSFFNKKIERDSALLKSYKIIFRSEENKSKKQINEDLTLFNTPNNRQLFLNAISLFNENYVTKKEMECARLLMEGNTSKEIARCLGVSYRTIESRVDSLKNKFYARNKCDLLIKLLQK